MKGDRLTHYASLPETLRSHAELIPNKIACIFLPESEVDHITYTYRQLFEQICRLSGIIRQSHFKGERVLILYPDGYEFVRAFLACTFSELVAVPAYPPPNMKNDKYVTRLSAIIENSGVTLVLTNSKTAAIIQEQTAGNPIFESLDWEIVSDETINSAPTVDPIIPAMDGIAFLQYTSGSTGSPKGVMVAHENIMHNETLITHGFRATADDVIVGWLPLFHDMGLIGNLLQPLCLGATTILMQPIKFLKNPYHWLKAIETFGATISGGPNFAYDYCVDRISEEKRAELDLSKWRVAYTGSEPIAEETLRRFTKAFAPHGFSESAFVPCYGLAENTLLVSVHDQDQPRATLKLDAAALRDNQVHDARDGQSFQYIVGSGESAVDLDIRIVDHKTHREVARGHIGEIWVSGKSAARGYWNQESLSDEIFRARLANNDSDFMRTGDLGFFHGEQLFITGRLKDLIIIRGRNYYPQDIESAITALHPAMRSGCNAAFSIEDGTESRLVLVSELEREGVSEIPTLKQQIRTTIAETFQVHLHDIVFIKARSIPKTTSGKIRRRATRTAYETATLRVIETQEAESEEVTGLKVTAKQLCDSPAIMVPTLARIYLRQQVARIASIPATAIDENGSLLGLGLDSLRLIELRVLLEQELAVSVAVERILEGMTFSQLVAEVADRLEQGETISAPQPGSADEEHRYILAYPQRGMMVTSQLNSSDLTYNIPVAIRFKGELDAVLLGDAINVLRQRHEILRTRFPVVGGKPFQQVQDYAAEPLHQLSFSYLNGDQAEQDAIAWMNEQAHAPFNVNLGPLTKVTLLQLSSSHHILFFNTHHIVFDGWSMGIYLREIAAYYRAMKAGAKPDLVKLPYQYGDYSVWQNERLQGEYLDHLVNEWSRRLGGADPSLNIPTASERPEQMSYHGSSRAFLLDEQLVARVDDFCRKQDVTRYMVLLSAHQLVLHHLSGSLDLCTGTASLGRNTPGSDNIGGNFVNMIVVRSQLNGNPSLEQFLRQTRREVLGAFNLQDLPFELLLARLEQKRELNQTPFFQASFGTQNLPKVEVDLPGCSLSYLELENGFSRYDLSLWVSDVEEGTRAYWTWRKSLFTQEHVTRFHNIFLDVLESLLSAPQKRFSALQRELRAKEKPVAPTLSGISLGTNKTNFTMKKPVVKDERDK